MDEPVIMGILPPRGTDSHGSGYFGAPRGDRTHNGIDLWAPPGTVLLCPIDGKVTRHGYPYADDLSFRYIEVTCIKSFHHRFFYVEPLIALEETIKAGAIFGRVQDLTNRYQGIRNHVHYEVMTAWGDHINPIEYHKQVAPKPPSVVVEPPKMKQFMKGHSRWKRPN